MAHEADKVLLDLREKLDGTVEHIKRSFSKLLETLKVDASPCISLGFGPEKSQAHKECDLEVKTHNLIRLFYDLLDIVATLRDMIISIRLEKVSSNENDTKNNEKLNEIKDLYNEILNRAETFSLRLLQHKIV